MSTKPCLYKNLLVTSAGHIVVNAIGCSGSWTATVVCFRRSKCFYKSSFCDFYFCFVYIPNPITVCHYVWLLSFYHLHCMKVGFHVLTCFRSGLGVLLILWLAIYNITIPCSKRANSFITQNTMFTNTLPPILGYPPHNISNAIYVY